MTRITPDDLNVVNDAVWAVRVEMDQMSHMYGTPVSAYLHEGPETSLESGMPGFFNMSELSGMVEKHLSGSKYLEGLSYGIGDMSLTSQFRQLFHVAVFETLLGYLYRMEAMSGSPDSPHVRHVVDMAHKYEESVLNRFSRWSDWDNLGEMSDWSLSWYLTPYFRIRTR